MVNFTEKEKGPVCLWWEGHNRSDTDVHLEVQAIQRVQINNPPMRQQHLTKISHQSDEITHPPLCDMGSKWEQK